MDTHKCVVELGIPAGTVDKPLLSQITSGVPWWQVHAEGQPKTALFKTVTIIKKIMLCIAWLIYLQHIHGIVTCSGSRENKENKNLSSKFTFMQ